jgi:hypothetical protein
MKGMIMVGIGSDTVEQFQVRINRFPEKYVQDWDSWMKVAVPATKRAQLFGEILRSWQACRPNEMRRDKASAKHEAPYLEDLIEDAQSDLASMAAFDISGKTAFTTSHQVGLSNLWKTFQRLVHAGTAHNGKAGAVGISKAVLLLSGGHIGPAFDEEVRANLGIKPISNAAQWIDALKKVNQDIRQFERGNKTPILSAAPSRFTGMPIGRLYDMALGPRA